MGFINDLAAKFTFRPGRGRKEQDGLLAEELAALAKKIERLAREQYKANILAEQSISMIHEQRAGLREEIRAGAIRELAMGLAGDLLPIIDGILACLDFAGENESLRAGLRSVLDRAEVALARYGITPIEALGGKFNPSLHNAVEVVEVSDLPPEIVLKEITRGYRLGEAVIRYSEVAVSKSQTGTVWPGME